MLKEVARENQVQGTGIQRPPGGAIVFEEYYGGIEPIPRPWIQVHRESRSASDPVDELSVATSEVENGIVVFDQGLKESLDKYFPYLNSVRLVLLEAVPVDTLKGISVSI
jgi:hypothetical protein